MNFGVGIGISPHPFAPSPNGAISKPLILLFGEGELYKKEGLTPFRVKLQDEPLLNTPVFNSTVVSLCKREIGEGFYPPLPFSPIWVKERGFIIFDN